MVWDGSAWSIVTSPNATGSNNYLESVSCVSASDCVAVGYTNTGSGTETLVMVWDGSAWSIVTSPNAGTSNDRLYSVSCVSATECVAVGYADIGDNVYETLVMVWNGSAWSIVTSPNAGTIDDSLYSVSCVSATECVAVGSTWTGSANETLVMVWDGNAWSIVTSPNASTSLDMLFSVSCASATECVAVGITETGEVVETLVVSLTGPVPPPTTPVPPSTTTVSSGPVVPAFTG
jgi:hypothetical protein